MSLLVWVAAVLVVLPMNLALVVVESAVYTCTVETSLS